MWIILNLYLLEFLPCFKIAKLIFSHHSPSIIGVTGLAYIVCTVGIFLYLSSNEPWVSHQRKNFQPFPIIVLEPQMLGFSKLLWLTINEQSWLNLFSFGKKVFSKRRTRTWTAWFQSDFVYNSVNRSVYNVSNYFQKISFEKVLKNSDVYRVIALVGSIT